MMVSSSVCEPAAPISHTSPHLRPCAGQVPLPLVTAIPQTISGTVDTSVQGGGVRGVGGGGWYQGTRDVTPVVQTKQVRRNFMYSHNGAVLSDISAQCGLSLGCTTM